MAKRPKIQYKNLRLQSGTCDAVLAIALLFLYTHYLKKRIDPFVLFDKLFVQ